MVSPRRWAEPRPGRSACGSGRGVLFRRNRGVGDPSVICDGLPRDQSRTRRKVSAMFPIRRRTAIGLIAAAAALSACAKEKPPVGGPFHLTDQNGRAVDESLLKGK